MTVIPPADDKKDPYREDHGLDEAKKKLSAIRGRPFEVDTVLAQHDARQERAIEVRKAAEEKIKEVRAKALQRQHEIRAEKAAKENQAAIQKGLELEEANLRFAKKSVEKQKDKKS